MVCERGSGRRLFAWVSCVTVPLKYKVETIRVGDPVTEDEMQNGNGVKDRYELPLTTESQQAADHYVDALDMFIAQTYGVEQEFGRAVEADEGLAVAHAALGLLQLYRSAPDEAKKSAERAKALAVHATKRERQQVEAISLMISGRNDKAYRLIQEHLKEFPRDILMVRLASRVLILGCSGAGVANFPEELLAMVKPLASDYGDDWAFLGQYAFAHHETGQFADALTYAERSLEQRPDNANASHSVAHVFFETGDPDGGSDFLGDWLRRVRQAGAVQCAPVLAPGAVPARYGKAGECGVAV